MSLLWDSGSLQQWVIVV